MRRILVLVLATVFLAAALVGCKSEPKVIKIGVVAPITGQNAIGGQYIKNGVNLAIEEFAKDGITVAGKKYTVEVLFEDNENKPDITANAFRKLIDQDKVIAIVGPDASSTSLAGAPIAQAAKIPMVATFATNPKVTEVGDYIFRACFIDPFQGKVMAKYALETLGAKTAGILYNNGNDFSKGLTEYFKQNFEAGGGEVIAIEAYGGADIKDFNAQLTKIKEANPDVLFLPNAFFETGLQMNQARKAGLTMPFIGGDGWDSPDLPKIAAGAEEGSAFSAAFSPEDTRAEVQSFVTKYKSKYNDPPNSNATLAYEATAVVLNALTKISKLDGTELRDAIAQTNMDLPSGTITYDSSRNPQKSAVVMMFKDGVTRYVTTIHP